MKYLHGPQFLELFHQCKTACHLETQDHYNVPDETEPIRRFLAGEPDDYSWFDDWTDLVVQAKSRGATMSRIRVVTVPHTDYHRWLLHLTAQNMAAGEDIRYLQRDMVGADEIPADDWWLFNNEQVVFNLMDSDGVPVGGASTTDPQIVQRCRATRDRLWERAVKYHEYVDQQTR
ncbi:DUF6879 family protein [Nocardia brasiliensis]|uniref:DUF6879 family protein n=1 Tax=Nocardia brasiliensis TaxID=37326 RepID=UPI00245699C8|nr:DUF6879 family protein [Nocardia brasiliensis]